MQWRRETERLASPLIPAFEMSSRSRNGNSGIQGKPLETPEVAKPFLHVHLMTRGGRIQQRHALLLLHLGERHAQQAGSVALAAVLRQHQHHRDPGEIGTVRQRKRRRGERAVRRADAPAAPEAEHQAPVGLVLVPVCGFRKRKAAVQMRFGQCHDASVVLPVSTFRPASRNASACPGPACRARSSRPASRSSSPAARAPARAAPAPRAYPPARRSAPPCR